MVDVRPFQGLRYRPSAIGDLSLVISPPYDVVRVDQRGLLYQRSPYNIIRLEYGLAFPDDTPQDNVYTRAAHLFQRWRSQGVLGQEVLPAFYVLEESFSYQGVRRTRRGILGAVRLEPYETRKIFPHEHTSRAPKEDRLRLLKATRASFSPILALYRNGDRLQGLLDRITQSPPLVEAHGWDDITYRLWAVTDVVMQGAIRRAFADQPLYLADGHHRYETALAYQAVRRGAGSVHPDDAFNFAPMCLVAMDDSNLAVEAFHRLVAPLPPHLRLALQQAQERVFIQSGVSWPLTISNAQVLLKGLGGERGVVGFADREQGHLYLLQLRPGVLRDLAPHQALLGCDTWVLHEGVLWPALGGDRVVYESKVAFVHSLEEVFHGLASGEASLAYLLRPIPWEVFTAVVEAGMRLPPKSTYFYPKLPAGLVIYPLEGRLPAP
ncbi:MAG: DUF1015 domain-containing protein [Dehalococcoidia bacterium]